MNYRHAYHAGNFADVVKHVALCVAILNLRRKEAPFRIIDSHAGRALYDLGGEEAARTGEAKQGIERLGDLEIDGLPASLAAYLSCVRKENAGLYPGSPRIAARLVREQDKLVAIEKHADEAQALRRALAEFPQAKVIEADGHERLPALLPPPERRGLILIDPPYEAADEFQRVPDLLVRAHRRFATGIYLIWYPVKSRSDADAFCGEIAAKGISDALRIEIDTGGSGDRLAAAGLLIVHPPYGFREEMEAVSMHLAPRLGCAGLPAEFSIRDL